MATPAELQSRLNATHLEIASLIEAEERLNGEIGAAIARVADAKEVDKLRAERRDARDRMEDLQAAVPFIERELQLAQAEMAAKVAAESGEAGKAKEAAAAELGPQIRKHVVALGPLVAELDRLDGGYQTDEKRARAHAQQAGIAPPAFRTIAAASGLPDGLLRDLRAFIARVETTHEMRA